MNGYGELNLVALAPAVSRAGLPTICRDSFQRADIARVGIEGISENDCVIAPRTGADQGNRDTYQFFDAANVPHRSCRQLRPLSYALGATQPALHFFVDWNRTHSIAKPRWEMVDQSSVQHVART